MLTLRSILKATRQMGSYGELDLRGVRLPSNSPSIFRAMPGYPWLPCTICGFNGSCDHTVLERARATHPGLIVPETNRQ